MNNFFMDTPYTRFESVETPTIKNPVLGDIDVSDWADEIYIDDNNTTIPIVKPEVLKDKMIYHPEENTGRRIVQSLQPQLEQPQLEQPQQGPKLQQRVKVPENTKLYIEQYSKYAMEQMRKYRIPASITLAQGILETNSGKSKLAQSANNHFGIKGKYNGNFVLANDDLPNEKFKKYNNPLDSFEDHSKLLLGRRYLQQVGNLDIFDYRGWARGLKRAGYATASNYAESLINIIEKYGLLKYDKEALEGR